MTESRIVVLLAVLPLILSACGVGSSTASPSVLEAPGTVELNQGSSDDVPLGGGGTGTVDFRGKLYRFAIGGDGVQGSAIAILQTTGEVYHLADIARFAGAYRRANATAVPGRPDDGLWLQNERATIMHLRTPPGGRMPDIGHDAVLVVLNGQ